MLTMTMKGFIWLQGVKFILQSILYLKGGVSSSYSLFVVIIVLGGRGCSGGQCLCISICKCCEGHGFDNRCCPQVCSNLPTNCEQNYCRLWQPCSILSSQTEIILVILTDLVVGGNQPVSCYVESYRHPNAYKTKAQAPFGTIIIVFCRYITTVPVDWNRLIYTGQIKQWLTEVAVTHTAHYSTYTQS